MKWVIALILAAAGIPLGAWALMVTVGVVHGEWLPMLPTLGYWNALAITATMAAFTVIGAFLKGLVEGVLGD
jgi:hypothetical protein